MILPICGTSLRQAFFRKQTFSTKPLILSEWPSMFSVSPSTRFFYLSKQANHFAGLAPP
jgi:hypothetical protein